MAHYNTAANTYTLPNGTVVGGGVYYPVTNTYVVTGACTTRRSATIQLWWGGTASTTTGTGPTGVRIREERVQEVRIREGRTLEEPPPTSTTATTTPYNPTPTNSGVTWVPDTAGEFNATAINQLNDTNPSGPGTIFNPTVDATTISGNGGPDALATTLAALGISAAACGVFAAKAAPAAAAGVTAGAAVTAAAIPNAILAVPVSDAPGNIGIAAIAGTAAVDSYLHVNDTATDFWSCLTRSWAKVVLQQITQSIVNWINSGFNGQPSFMRNQEAFFANVSDQVAGQFIAGSGLAFLCSPFSLQIKIAIAQAYASRNQAPACTLTQTIRNVQGFMRGNFAAGGWPGLLSVVTIPTNNPYGAFAYGQIALTNAQLSAREKTQAS